MSGSRTRRALLGVGAFLAVGLIGPAAAEASTLTSAAHAPMALLGINVGSLVGDIIKKLVDLVVPDFGSHWAAALVKWLVAVPDVADRNAYPHLNQFRDGLVSLGYALLAVTLTLAGLQTIGGDRNGGESLKRAGIAAFVLANYTTFVSTAILGVNVLTGSMVTSHLVTNGIDNMLGAALVVAVVTGGLSLGLATGAAVACLYFMASLMVFKIGLTALQAVLMLAGALVWGLYPLHSTAWLARAWSAAALSLVLIPVAWALIFSAGALLSSDSLLWSTGGPGGLSAQLQQVVKPFAAVACFWVAYRAPNFLVATARSMGLHPAAMVGGSVASRGGASGGRNSNPLGAAVQTNLDRFGGLGAAVAGRAAPATQTLRHRASNIRSAAAASVGFAVGSPSSARGMSFDAATKIAGTVGKPAALPIKANAAYRGLAVRGADARRKAAAASYVTNQTGATTAGVRQRPGQRASGATTAKPATGAVTTGTPAQLPPLPTTTRSPVGDRFPATAAAASGAASRTLGQPGTGPKPPAHVRTAEAAAPVSGRVTLPAAAPGPSGTAAPDRRSATSAAALPARTSTAPSPGAAGDGRPVAPTGAPATTPTTPTPTHSAPAAASPSSPSPTPVLSPVKPAPANTSASRPKPTVPVSPPPPASTAPPRRPK